ncbi:hypothetical protein L208DRAFT_1391162 [Tricholoma matsutake]|nr:hypothetical protein L208DRAFT_1391162 [Tricholoma matsutake 945]
MACISMLFLRPVLTGLTVLLFVSRSANCRPNQYCNRQDRDNRSSYIGYGSVQSRLFFGLRDQTFKH